LCHYKLRVKLQTSKTMMLKLLFPQLRVARLISKVNCIQTNAKPDFNWCNELGSANAMALASKNCSFQAMEWLRS
jgi:hypothetical protein